MAKENSSHRFVKINLNKDSKKRVVTVSEDEIVEEIIPKEESTEVEVSTKKVKMSKKKEENGNNKKINQELEEIYKNGDGTMPNMSDFKRKKNNRLMRAVIFLLLACGFLGAVAWAGFFFFQPQSRFNENDVVLSISGEEKVSFGQEVTYRIRYRNAQNIPLSKVNLQVRYPGGFVFEKASKTPDTDKNDEWTLGALNQQDSGYIDVTGRMYGNVGDQQSFRMFLNYVPSNFNSEFQKVNNVNIEIISPEIEMSVSGPEEISIGSEAEFTFEIKKPEEILNNVILLVEPVAGFNKVSSEPKSDENQNYQWSVDLSKDQTVKIKGTFNPGDGEEEANLF